MDIQTGLQEVLHKASKTSSFGMLPTARHGQPTFSLS
jgi:hypothetical protein